MTLLARILSHGFAIAIVVLLAIGLVYRGKLFPEYELPDFLDIGKLADRGTEATRAGTGTGTGEQPPAVAPEEPAADTVAPADLADSAPADEAAAADQGAVTPPQTAVVEVQQPEPAIEPETAPAGLAPEEGGDATVAPSVPADTGGEGGDAAGDTPPQPSVPPVEETAEPDVSAQAAPAVIVESAAEAEPETSETPAEIMPASSQQASQKPYQLLAEAREAYWLRDYESAEARYLQLIRVDPDNPDGYGELGNMYFSQGQWEQAATAYFEAGSRLVAQGLLEQAEEMVAVIRGLNGAHADELTRKIEAASSSAE